MKVNNEQNKTMTTASTPSVSETIALSNHDPLVAASLLLQALHHAKSGEDEICGDTRKVLANAYETLRIIAVTAFVKVLNTVGPRGSENGFTLRQKISEINGVAAISVETNFEMDSDFQRSIDYKAGEIGLEFVRGGFRGFYLLVGLPAKYDWFINQVEAETVEDQSTESPAGRLTN